MNLLDGRDMKSYSPERERRWMMPEREAPVFGVVETTEDLGKMLRSKRKALGMTQERASGLLGVGIRFLSELERGKPTAEIGKVLQVVRRLGLNLCVEPKTRRG